MMHFVSKGLSWKEARTRPERVTASLLQMLAATVATAPSFEAALQAATERVCTQLGWTIGEVWVPDRAVTALTPSEIGWTNGSAALQAFRQASSTAVVSRGEDLPGRVWATGKPIWMSDVSQLPAEQFQRRQLARAMGLKASLGIPVLDRDRRILAVLLFFADEVRRIDRRLVRTLQTIATQLAARGSLQQTERDLNVNRRQFQATVDTLPGVVFSSDANERRTMQSLSQGCRALTGYRSAELLGDAYNALLHAADRGQILLAIRRAITTGRSYTVEYRLQTKAGDWRWVCERGCPLWDDRGNFLGLQGFIADVTARKQSEIDLQEAEIQYRSIFENAIAGIYQTTLTGQYRRVNPMLAQIYGYESPAALMVELIDIGGQLYVEPRRRQEFSRRMAASGWVRGFESQVRRRDGSIIWISECAWVLRDRDGHPIGYEGTVEDITRRKDAEAESQRKERLLAGVAKVATLLLHEPNFDRAIPEMLAIFGEAVDADRAYVYENHGCPQDSDNILTSMRFEWTRAGIAPTIDRPHWQGLSYQDAKLQGWYEAFAAGKPVGGVTAALSPAERKLLARDDIRSILMVPVLVGDCPWGFIGFDACREARQWTESEESILVTAAASLGSAIGRQQAETRQRQQAYSDPLTGLPNRLALEDAFSAAIAQSRLARRQLAVLFFDLDGFKIVNDGLGHATGDALLQQLAERLRWQLPPNATLARWGGDEFVCLLPSIDRPEAATAVAKGLQAAIAPPFELANESLHLTGSLGIALYPRDGDDRETLLRNADAALFVAKQQGRNRIASYTPTFNARATQRLQLENQLHRALEAGELLAYYQPIVAAASGQPLGMEALLRWQHPELGWVSPGTFIPLAEENGTIVSLGEWILKTASEQYARWQAQGIAPQYVAVNLSPVQLREASLCDRLAAIVAAAAIDPGCLQLEITETAAMQNLGQTLSLLQSCRNLGLQVALDDFGTGYASLSHLRRFPLDALKIDRAFVTNIATSSEDEAIAETILTLGRGLGLRAIAEGVETPAQLQRLLALGCEQVQGFLYSRPMDAAAATAYLAGATVSRSLSPAKSARRNR